MRPYTLLLISLVACSRGDDRRDLPPMTERPPGVADTVPRALGAGDVRIPTRDGQFDLALIGDSVSSGLSETSLRAAREGIDTSAVSGEGIGASIERAVKGAVGGVIAKRVSFPLSAITDVRYDSGALRFQWAGEPSKLFEQTKINGRPLLESFDPAEAQRFVEAVRARKGVATPAVLQ